MTYLPQLRDPFGSAILGLKNKKKLQDSGGPFGFWGVKFSRRVWIFKKEKPSSGIG